MFSWFRSKPTCPVEPQQRAWLEGRVRWLISEFGLDRARSVPVVLPTPEFFPEPYDASQAAGRVLFDRVCKYMGIAPGGLELAFYEGKRFPHVVAGGWQPFESAAGLYEQTSWGTRIQMDASSLSDPLDFVATATHELAHVLLLGQGRLTGDEPDHEEMTDLLTIYLGLGVFTANTRVRDRSEHAGTSESWSIRRLGYLGQPQVGYALALWARLRQEKSPVWAKQLCADVRAYFTQSARWLEEHGDSVLDAQTGSPCALSDDQLPPGFEARR